MKVEEVKKYVGKKVEIILKNSWRFTFVMPNFEGTVFSITDKFDKPADIDCELIMLIREVQE